MALETFARQSLAQFAIIYSEIFDGKPIAPDQLETLMWGRMCAKEAGITKSSFKIPFENIKRAKVTLPYMPDNITYTGCCAIKKNGGLYTPCCGKVAEDAYYCKTCSVDKDGDAKELEFGTIDTREANIEDERFAPITFGEWMKGHNTTLTEVYSKLAAAGIAIEVPAEQLVCRTLPKTRRGRPSKSDEEVSDEDSPAPKKKPTPKAKKASPKASPAESEDEAPKKKKVKSDDEAPKKKKVSDDEAPKKKPKVKEPEPESESESEPEPEPVKAKPSPKPSPKASPKPSPKASPKPSPKTSPKSSPAVSEDEAPKKAKAEKPKEKKAEKPAKEPKAEKKAEKPEKAAKEPKAEKAEKPAKEPKAEKKAEKPAKEAKAEKPKKAKVPEPEPEELDVDALAAAFEQEEPEEDEVESCEVDGKDYNLRNGKYICDMEDGTILGTIDDEGDVVWNSDKR